MMLVRVYQDEHLASVRLTVDKVVANENKLELYNNGQYIGLVYFDSPQDCHHIEVD